MDRACVDCRTGEDIAGTAWTIPAQRGEYHGESIVVCAQHKAARDRLAEWGELSDLERAVIQHCYPRRLFPDDLDMPTLLPVNRLLRRARFRAGHMDPTLTPKCGRCDGVGHYFVNVANATCFGCGGAGKRMMSVEKHFRRYMIALDELHARKAKG